MVYVDLNDTAQPTNAQPVRYYAGPFTRCFSALLDYLIFFPIVAFFITLLFKSSVIAMGVSTTLTAQVFVFYILFFTFLQTVFIYFYGATPGQSFLKLYVQFEGRQANVFFQIWFRQLGFVLSIVFLGLPFLAVFYHHRRRPFYDRFSECDILTLAPVEEFYLQDLDRKYMAAGVSVIICFFSTLSLVFLFQSHYVSLSQFRTAHQKGTLDKKCFQIEDQNPEERLKTALALNLLHRLSEECVVSEAYPAFEGSDLQLKALAYFTKYQMEKDSEDKKKYFALACQDQVKSDLCPQREVANVKADDEDAELLKKLKLKETP